VSVPVNYFKDSELACTHCGMLKIHRGFRDELNGLRAEFGLPMKISGPGRCKAHNAAVGGHPRSLHIMDEPQQEGQQGMLGVDVATPDGSYRGKLFAVAWKRGWSIGWNAKKRFLHLDRRIDVGLKQTSFDY
jgi:hypothetical protein